MIGEVTEIHDDMSVWNYITTLHERHGEDPKNWLAYLTGEMMKNEPFLTVKEAIILTRQRKWYDKSDLFNWRNRCIAYHMDLAEFFNDDPLLRLPAEYASWEYDPFKLLHEDGRIMLLELIQNDDDELNAYEFNSEDVVPLWQVNIIQREIEKILPNISVDIYGFSDFMEVLFRRLGMLFCFQEENDSFH